MTILYIMLFVSTLSVSLLNVYSGIHYKPKGLGMIYYYLLICILSYMHITSNKIKYQGIGDVIKVKGLF